MVGLSSHLDFGEGRELKVYAFEKITVDTAIGFTTAKLVVTGYDNAIRAFVTVETDEIRYTVDGTTPTSTTGHLVTAGQNITIEGITNVAAFRAIKVTTNALLQVSYQRYTND